MKDNASELNSALQGTVPVLVEFYATWCPHCQREAPIVERLTEETGDAAAIICIDEAKHPDLVEKFGVKGFPAWFLFKDGQQVWNDSGEKPYDELKDMIDRFK